MKVTKELLSSPQVDFAMRYIVENNFTYDVPIKSICNQPPLGVLEFGVGEGKSLKKICSYLKANDMDHNIVIGFDSWQGLPEEDPKVDCFVKYKKGSYKFNYHPSLYNYIDYENLLLKQYIFDNIPDDYTNELSTAILVHIDSDLYLSAKQALDWCFRNKLIVKHSLIAFDEYCSTNGPGGEKLAFQEIQNKYKFDAEEIFHYNYFDKDTGQKFRQNVFEITGI